MSDIAIRVEGLGKQYRIGGQKVRYRTIRETLVEASGAPFRRLSSVVHGQSSADLHETFWALKDVSFEIKHGEAVGIIGRNGAGKTTLLKILSRITEPTAGGADIRGRVGSLLEVGTGFHPELTGRENIYLNGAILGMKRAEIERKFDEMVAFAEVEQFIDTPVKHYSSGMYVRLAFSVAAHLEPEILLVDEVLAVGDVAFQKKCLGQMGKVAHEGRTVLFVSHNMAAMKRLCGSAIWLDSGQLVMLGESDEVVTEYEDRMLSNLERYSARFPMLNQHYGLTLETVDVNIVPAGEYADLRIGIRLTSRSILHRVGFRIIIHTHDGTLVTQLGPKDTNLFIDKIDGCVHVAFECPDVNRFLACGEYSLSLMVLLYRTKVEKLIVADHIASFNVPGFDHYGSGRYFQLGAHGLVPLPLRIRDLSHEIVCPVGPNK